MRIELSIALVRVSILTRGDNHSRCDLPVPANDILSAVSERMVNGQRLLFDDRVPFESDRRTRHRIIERLLLVCPQIDVRLAQRASRSLMWLGRWRRWLLAKLQPGKLTK
jgi:hypothetical protein